MRAPPTQLEFNRRTIINNIATLFSGSAAAQGMTAIALLLTARQLGALNYGQYASSFVFTSISSIVFSLGLDIWLLHKGGRQPNRLDKLLGSVFSIKIVLGAIWLGIIFLISPIMDSSTFPSALLRLSAISVWLDSLFGTTLTAFKASLRNRTTSILEAGSDLLWLSATIVLIIIGSQNVVDYIQVRVAVLSFSLFFSLVLAWRNFHIVIVPGLPTVRNVLREILPYASSEFLAWAWMRIDVLIIAAYLGELAAGLYSPAVGIANALFLIPAAVYMVIMPILSNLFSNNVEQAWLTARRSILLLGVIGVLSSVALFIGARPLIQLLGSSFTGSLAVLRILSSILFFHSISFGMAAILVAANLQARRTIVQAIAVALNAVLNISIVPWAGIQGAAVVYLISEVVLLAGYTYLVYQYRIKTRPALP